MLSHQPNTTPAHPEYAVTCSLVTINAVASATYSKLFKNGGRSILEVTYHCDDRSIKEAVCFEHGTVLLKQAVEWWTQRTTVAIPRSVNEALERSSALRIPIALKVGNLKRSYPVILEYIWHSIN